MSTERPDPTPPSAPADDGPLDDIESGIKISADFGLAIGTGLDEISHKLSRYFDALQRATPTRQNIPAAAQAPASGGLLLSFGAPDEGTVWDVRGFGAGGTEVNVTAAGTVGLYVAAFQDIRGAGITNLRAYAPAVPAAQQFGSGQILVNDGEFVFLVIWTPTAAQQYGANLSIDVINQAELGDVAFQV